MKKITFTQRFRYKFDNLLNKETISIMALLGIISLILVKIIATVLAVSTVVTEGGKSLNFVEGEFGKI